MTLPEAESLLRYWQEFPSPHLSLRRLAAAQAAWQPEKPADSPEKPSEQADLGILIRAFSAGGGLISAF